MTISDDARARLAAAQSALVEALMAGREVPEGFDADRVRLTSISLERKRLRTVARCWPGLLEGLGSEFELLFLEYAQNQPLPRDGGPLADGLFFADWLNERRRLPSSVRPRILAVELRYRRTRQGIVKRLWPVVKGAWLRSPTRWLLAAWCPGLGEMWLSIPVGREV